MKKVIDVELSGAGIRNVSLTTKKEYTVNCFDLIFAPDKDEHTAKEGLSSEIDAARKKDAEEKAGAAIAFSALGGLALALLLLFI